MYFYWIFLSMLSVPVPGSTTQEPPQEYCLDYIGEDEIIGEVFQNESLGGQYTLEDSLPYNGVPFWVKREPSPLYIYRNDNGQWTVSQNLAIRTGILFQDSVRDPVPSADLPWIIKIETKFHYNFESTPDIVLAASFKDDKQEEEEEKEEE